MSDSRKLSRTFQSFKKGERQGYEYYFHLHKDGVYRLALATVKRIDEAEDILIETFRVLWDRRDLIEDEHHLRSSLYDTAKKKCYTHLRRQKMQQGAEFTWALSREDQGWPGTQEARTERLQQLAADIDNLPPQRRLVLKLLFFKGMTYKRIAELLNLSEQTVRNHYNKARLGLGGKKGPGRSKGDKKNIPIE